MGMKTKKSVRVSPKALLMDALEAKAVAVREADSLREEVRQLRFTVASQREQARMLDIALAEEDARAEAFEFVLRMHYGASTVAAKP